MTEDKYNKKKLALQYEESFYSDAFSDCCSEEPRNPERFQVYKAKYDKATKELKDFIKVYPEYRI